MNKHIILSLLLVTATASITARNSGYYDGYGYYHYDDYNKKSWTTGKKVAAAALSATATAGLIYLLAHKVEAGVVTRYAKTIAELPASLWNRIVNATRSVVNAFTIGKTAQIAAEVAEKVVQPL